MPIARRSVGRNCLNSNVSAATRHWGGAMRRDDPLASRWWCRRHALGARYKGFYDNLLPQDLRTKLSAEL